MQRVAHRKSDEIHQLRKELKAWVGQAASLEMRLAGAEAENRRLRAAIQEAADYINASLYGGADVTVVAHILRGVLTTGEDK